MAHPLDNPIWSALTTRQAHLAIGNDRARRFPSDISPFAAAPDGSPTSSAALAALLPAGGGFAQMQPAPTPPPAGVPITLSAIGVQMTATRITPGSSDATIIDLGEADAPEMQALASLTRPGPFLPRTHTMGRFIGVRNMGRLIAMAGERLQPVGFTEISAVCTHPDHVGHGYGAALVRAVGARIFARGDTAFLHAYATNTGAIALYRKLGFDLRAEVTVSVWGELKL
ncbi:MAG: GNAT family N-acetyltransferase [Alphaproteobacteria bacterium]